MTEQLRSLAATPAQWTDAPPPRRTERASRHVIAPCVEVYRRLARGTPVVLAVTTERPLRVTRPGRYRSLTAMSAGFEIERLLTG